MTEANSCVGIVKSQNERTAGGWREPFDIGRYGSNCAYRAAVHELGLVANVRLENYAFNTFVDADGASLEGARGPFTLRLDSVPPSDFFWSVTVYVAATQEVHANPAGRHLVSSNTPGLLIAKNSSVTVTLSTDAHGANGIPALRGRFHLALRAQGPRR